MAVFGDLNEVKLIGNITQDIELRSASTGNNVTNFSIATNRRFKSGEEWKDDTTFHNIVVWGNDAEYLSQKARKGTRVFISGRIQNRSWEDQEGNKKNRTEVVADKVILLDRYERTTSEDSQTFSKPQASVAKKTSKPSQVEENSIDPDDLPF